MASSIGKDHSSSDPGQKNAGRWQARPGCLQYVYTLLVPAVFFMVGISVIVYGLSPQANDLGTRTVIGIVMAAPAVLWAIYLSGMSVEVDAGYVTKIFFFGWLRESIPRDQLAASVSKERWKWSVVFGSYSRVDFMSADGKGAFSLYPAWVWRGRDVDALLRMQARPWDPEAPMRRQNWILTAGVLALPLSSLLIVIAGIVVAITEGVFHWP